MPRDQFAFHPKSHERPKKKRPVAAGRIEERTNPLINRDSTSTEGGVNKHLAHRDDPQSSKDAAANLNPRTTERVKSALLELLAEQPSAPFEVQALYQLLRPVRDWPKVQPHSVNRRLSELKKAGRVRGTGVLVPTPDGATAERLEVTPDAEAAA